VEEAKKRGRSPDLDVKALPKKKCGRPLTLQEEIDLEVQQYILHLREISGPVNGAVVRASGRGILKRKMVEAQGSKEGPGPTIPVLTKDLRRYLLQFVKRKANTKATIHREFCTVEVQLPVRHFRNSRHGGDPAISHN